MATTHEDDQRLEALVHTSAKVKAGVVESPRLIELTDMRELWHSQWHAGSLDLSTPPRV